MSLCPVPRVAPAGDCEGHKGTVILGLDPRIHVNKLALLLIWIAGSSPAMTKKKICLIWIPGSSPGMTRKRKYTGDNIENNIPGNDIRKMIAKNITAKGSLWRR